MKLWEGTCLEKKFIRKIILIALLCLMTLTSGFSQTISLEEEVTYGSLLKDLGLVVGELREDDLITREEMANYVIQVPMYFNYLNANIPQTSPYDDVSTDRWSYKGISVLTEKGVLRADNGRTFNPTRPISYAEVAQLIMANLGYKVTLEDAVFRAEKEQGIFCDAAKGQDYLTRGQFFELLAKMFNGDRGMGHYVLYNLFLFPKADLIEFEEKLFDLRKKKDVTENGWSTDTSLRLMPVYDFDFNSHEGVNEYANERIHIIKNAIKQAKPFDLNAYHKNDRIVFDKVLMRDFIVSYDRWDDYSKQLTFLWESNRPGKYFKVCKTSLEKDVYYVEPAMFRGAYKIDNLKLDDHFNRDVYILDYEVLDTGSYRQTEHRQLVLVGDLYGYLDSSYLLLEDRSLVCGAPTYSHIQAYPWAYRPKDANGHFVPNVLYREDFEAGYNDIKLANVINGSSFDAFESNPLFEFDEDQKKIYYNRIGSGSSYLAYDWTIDLSGTTLEIQVTRQNMSLSDKKVLIKAVESLPLNERAVKSVEKFINTNDEKGAVEGYVTYYSTIGTPLYVIRVAKEGYELKPDPLNIPYKEDTYGL